MNVTSTCAILASDFSPSTTDKLRRNWSVGKMAHVIAALDGAPVAITTDRQTGHTLVGVQLISAFQGGAGRGPRVQVRMTHTDGTTQDTNYYLWNVGEAIIPMERAEGSDAKWKALESFRRQCSEAIKAAQEEHGESEGRAWGSWEATPIDATSVGVRYTPSTGNPAFADRWGTRWSGNVRTEAVTA
jgi:hypothetical protein